ncbi:aminotransferase-like domain-containing protein [Vibrio japonicus]|uniref:PLP-dependent aminotransferase family protein n=1 Tax=Vibrio japonicus TaxID=1824638 RepID=A0ABY5LKI8_9VIBR|nr:PLP-dependent aminotransferase family protein [Vibrio japonicus]UUM31615.1 PLP-dependent aminotransferase family protein [Vibrio japonicus]
MNRYQQLATDIKQLIENETWRAGEKIPSVRVMSRSVSVSASTVLQAYQLLESEGWIKAKPQSGYFVSPDMERGHAPPVEHHFSQTEYKDELYEYLRNSSQVDAPLGLALPDSGLYPFQTLTRHLASAGRKMPANSAVSDLPPGNEQLRRLIAQRYLRNGVVVSHQDIVITSGAMEALNLSLQVVSKPGDHVVIEDPVFYGAIEATQRNQLVAVPVTVEPCNGIDLEGLENAFQRKSVSVCWLMPNYQNPTGALYSDKSKKTIVELANQYDVNIIEDDVYSELHFSANQPKPLKYWDEHDRVLLCGSFSKSLCPGYRIGWVVNRKLSERLQKQQLLSTLSSSFPIQQGVAHYLQYESYDNHLRKLRKELCLRQKQYTKFIEATFPSGTQIFAPNGGYFLWLKLPEQLRISAIYQQLISEGISFGYGSLFSAQGRYQNYIRLNISFELNAKTESALQRIAERVHTQLFGDLS